MSWRLVLTFGCNLLFVNAVVFLFELAGRTLMPAFHLLVSALVVFLLLGAVLLMERLHAPAIVGAASIPVVFILLWCLSRDDTSLDSLPGLVIIALTSGILMWGPLLVMNWLLLAWLARTSSFPPVRTSAVAMVFAVLVAAVTAFVAHRSEAAERTRYEVQRANELRTKQEHLAALRAAVAAGDQSRACELFANDPFARPEEFTRCRERLDALPDAPGRWKELSHFLQGSSFKTWSEADLVDGGSFLGHTPVIPPNDQAWFVRTYATTWIALGDAEVLEDSGYVCSALVGIQDARFVVWTDASRHVLDGELKRAMIDRLERALRSTVGSEASRAQAEQTIRFLKQPT